MNGDETNKPQNLIAAAIDAAEEIRDPLEGLVERAVGRVISRAGRNRLRRPRHQWPPGDLANPCQGHDLCVRHCATVPSCL